MKLSKWAHDITNKRFERLIAKKPLHVKNHLVYWLCDCDCGNKTTVATAYLNYGSVRSCGCLLKESLGRKQPFGNAALTKLMDRYIRQAKNRDISFRLTRKYFKELTSSNCYYCKIPPAMSITKYDALNGDYVYNGIDRISSDRGYIKNNVVPCCGICNRAKMTLTRKEFKDWIRRLINANSSN